MNATTITYHRQASVVAALRSLVPRRPLTFSEAQRIAELQAVRLLELLGCSGPPVSLDALAALPRTEYKVAYDLDCSGSTSWHQGRWHIRLNGLEPYTRIRFTAAHETKHMLDASLDDVIFSHLREGPDRERHIEAICDHFAASLLMPRSWLRHHWTTGTQRVSELARIFDVSADAMTIRLQVLGLLERPPRDTRRLGSIGVRSTVVPPRTTGRHGTTSGPGVGS